MYKMFKLNYTPYTDIKEYVSYISQGNYKKVYKRKNNKSGYYVYDIPCAFDIETSSFYRNGEKQVIMYIWQFAFNGNVIIGRTWEQFIELLQALQKAFNLSEDLQLYVYIHNESYEFQFIRKRLNWVNVFSVDTRKPIKALCTYGIEFKDSYILSGYSLDTVGKNLHTYKVRKLVGYLDYDKIRTPETPLTDKEIAYCINDVLVVSAYIQEYIESVGKITNIPLTQTGTVRNFCRKNCYYGFSKDKNIRQQTYYDYRALMSSLKINSIEEYNLLKRAFQGGFTHANAEYVGKINTNVSSYDFTSSYPYVMLSEKFPMGTGFRLDNFDFRKFSQYRENYLMVFDLHLIGVQPRVFADNPISISRCYKQVNSVVNNGRVVYADELYLSATNIDLDVYLAFYEIDHVEISNCYCYAKDYLPKNFILSILKVYNDKTKLKGVKGSEKEYLHAKELLNSMYGMSVTDIIQDLITYDDINEWDLEEQDKNELLKKYNESKNRFLFYPWGIFVTSYARRNLFSGILECSGDKNHKSDYIYSDTDSVKIMNRERHEKYFTEYNQKVEQKLRAMCDHYEIDFNLCKPKTIKGKEKLIGVWDYEGDYLYFKTLGAKRYMYYDNDLHSTVAGVSKQGVVNYLKTEYHNYRREKLHGKNVSRETFIKFVFGKFNNQLVIPDEFTGKLTHTYIDTEMTGVVKDYFGKQYQYDELSGVHLSKTDYKMTLSQAFIDFLNGVQYERQL